VIEPKLPKNVSPFARSCLDALAAGGLETPIDGVWPGGLCVDSLDDLVASKMSALIERGAPRDFRDISSICEARLCTVARCWQLWGMRQRLAHEDAEGARARSAIATHLARIAVARPLEGIPDAEQREAAARLRAWFEKEFLA
jgi:hypothetical protein